MRAFLIIVALLPGLAAAQRSDWTQIEQVEIEQLAQIWEITPEEYRRYLVLKQGPAKAFAVSTLTPQELLGYYARTDEERKKWADAFTAIRADYVGRYTAFQQEFAQVRSTPTTPSFMKQVGDRLLLKIPYPCDGDCQKVVQSGLAKARARSMGLDIFAPAGTDPKVLPVLAKAMNLPVKWIEDERLTLWPATKQEEGLFPQTPYFLLQRLGGEIIDIGPSLNVTNSPMATR